MAPIAELVFKMSAIMTFYRIKYVKKDKIFKKTRKTEKQA